MTEIRALARRVHMMIGRGVVGQVDDSGGIQAHQIDLLADETHDAVERLQNYGFTSVPLPGAEAAVAFVGGLRSHGLILAVGDRRYRMKGLAGGEVAMHDDQGQSILLGRDGIAIVTTKPLSIEATDVTLTADSVLIDSGSIDLGGDGGPAVARVGDTVEGGVITSGSDKVRAA